MEFEDIIAQEVFNRFTGDSRGFISVIACAFDIDSRQIGGMFTPPKSRHTINGYKRAFTGDGATSISDEGRLEVIRFIEKYYRGKNPRRNLLNKIERDLNN